MQRYAITDRTMFPGDKPEVEKALLAQAARLAAEGVEYLQLREKDLPEGERVQLARDLALAIRSVGGVTQLLLSGTPTLAQWAGVNGVHLPSSQLSQGANSHHGLIVSASCHTLDDVRRASEFAHLILFAPVFEKRVDHQVAARGVGLERLREACLAAGDVPVFALGGVSVGNAQACLEAGAAGVAGIRMFA